MFPAKRDNETESNVSRIGVSERNIQVWTSLTTENGHKGGGADLKPVEGFEPSA